jgi:hypothetical protein
VSADKGKAADTDPAGDAAGAAENAGNAGNAETGDAGEPAGATRRPSRRFPLITRDTARPEGGGRAAPGDAPAPARQWPLLCVLTGTAAGLLVTLGDFRAGTLAVGLSVLSGAVLRWAVPSVGMLAVRSRFTDVVTYGVLGTAIGLLAMMVQPQPWLEFPFLEDVVHFTIR